MYIVKGEHYYMKIKQVLSNQDQEYILKALEAGLHAIKELKGEERIGYYNDEILKALHSQNELLFLQKLGRVLEEIEGELNEYVR